MKKNEGITLIALIITIIVLLILAGVSISMVVGENGIMSKAGKASEETKKASIEEKRNLAMAEAATNFENTEFQGVTIPAGFAPTRIDGESTVEEGLVIIDSKGNEFVWIPCTLEDYKASKDLVMKNEWPHESDYENNGNDETNGRGYAWRDIYTETDIAKINETYTGENSLPTNSWENDQISKAETSIGKYGGFYIARYEAGIPEEASFHISKTNNKYLNTKGEVFGYVIWGYEGFTRGSVLDTDSIRNLKPLSKQGVQAWNYITQPNAKMISENMYKENSSVGSYLVDSQAWNYICAKIFDNILDNEKNGKTIIDSRNIGNYYYNETTDYTKIKGLWAYHKYEAPQVPENYRTDNISSDMPPKGREKHDKIELATGLSDDFRIYNIYDMAGNMWEYTTAHNIAENNMFGVIRGGSFYDDIEEYGCVVYAISNGLVNYSFGTSFRVVLYIK